jgi:Glucodextranase, domain B
MEMDSLIRALAVVVALGLLPLMFPAEAAYSPGWGTAQLVEIDNSSDSYSPQVAVDPSGNAIAVWFKWDGARNDIWSNRYVVGMGWEIAQLIEADDSGDAEGPQVAVDNLGNAVAVWHQNDGTRDNIWSNRYVVGTGWETAQLVETNDSGGARDPQVAVDGLGNFVAVWFQYDGSRADIWSNRYVVGAGWEVAQLAETNVSQGAYCPDVAVASSGDAVAVWHQYDGTQHNIWANRYVVGTGWGTAELIENDLGEAVFPEVALDNSGNAVVVWEQWDGTRNNIWSNRYVVGTGWGTARLIENESAGASSPDVAVDGSGNAVAIWVERDGQYQNTSSNRYVVGADWGTAQLIGSTNSSSYSHPQVVADGSGNMLALWNQNDGTRDSIWSNRYVVGTGWGTMQLVETDNAGGAHSPQVAVDGSGNAIAVWTQYYGHYETVRSSRYVRPDTAPPALALSSPSDGMATESPVITVSGTTEPGAVVIIGGVRAAVAPDGSFACEIALVEGANMIVTTATDSAGNSATVSRNVVYNNPLSDLGDELNAIRDDLNTTREDLSSTSNDLEAMKSQNLMLMAVLAIFAVLAVVMSIMYFSLRKKIAGMSGKHVEKEPRPPQS